jgi:hypothetical protein
MADRNSAYIHLSEAGRAYFPDDANMAKLSMRDVFDAEETMPYIELEECRERYKP